MSARCIATRLAEAGMLEAIACFDQDARLKSLYSNGRGTWDIKPRPFLLEETSKVQGRAIRVVITPPELPIGMGQVATTTYIVTFQFVLPLDAMDFRRGEPSWYDDMITLQHWLARGGTKPNDTGSIPDPDYRRETGGHEFLTVGLVGCKFAALGRLPNERFLDGFDATWTTREDSQGNRA